MAKKYRPPFFYRSGEYVPVRRLRGGRASGLPPGAFAEVGRWIRLREASRRLGMHPRPALESENPPVWVGVGQIRAWQGFFDICQFSEVRQISAQHKSARPPNAMVLLSQDSGSKPNYKDESIYSDLSFPYSKISHPQLCIVFRLRSFKIDVVSALHHTWFQFE